MNQLINLSGDHVTFDVGEKKKQKVKIVGTFKPLEKEFEEKLSLKDKKF